MKGSESKIHTDKPVFDQPVVVSPLVAITHSQHAMVHIFAALVVNVHTCGATEDMKQDLDHGEKKKRRSSKSHFFPFNQNFILRDNHSP